jgi:hypothetical protein
MTLPARTSAVPAEESTLIPAQHRGTGTAPIPDSPDEPAVADDGQRTTVEARRRERRADLHLENPVTNLRTQHLHVIESEWHADTLHRGDSLLRLASTPTEGRPPPKEANVD